MFGIPLAFTSPWLLLALVSLPLIWWLLRLTPPRPQEETFPPTRILSRLLEREETPAQSPWWLTLLRLAMAALVILAMAGPVLNPDETELAGEGPVQIILDDGWASAKEWETRQQTALEIAQEAEKAGRPVMLVSTTLRKNWNGLPISAEEAIALINAAEPAPLLTDHAATAQRIEQAYNVSNPGSVHWLSDGLANDGTAALVAALSSNISTSALYRARTDELIAIGSIENNPSSLEGTLLRANADAAAEFNLTAHDDRNVVIARAKATFLPGEKESGFVFDQPVELRNQISKLVVENARSVSGVKLLDANNRRRLVGLISGETFDQSQPLLSPLYYISKALEPYSDIRRSDDANVGAAVPDLINQGVSAIILADVGTLPQEAETKLTKWMEEGGLLIRFAGPRLAAAPQGALLPVDIRPGDRNLGGALSWETPKPVAPFARTSPFFGIEQPRDVLVKKQLLAIQESDLEAKTWATLEDGTPLVTADKRAGGNLVLFHVGSDANWSNLPLSGTFVEMLRRTVNLSTSNNLGDSSNGEVTLPPYRLLDAMGNFAPAGEEVQPLVIKSGSIPKAKIENPPGFYGSQDGVVALNLFTENKPILQLSDTELTQGLETRNYVTGAEMDFTSWLLAAAALFLLLDCIAVLWMSGALRNGLFGIGSKSGKPALSIAVLIAASLVLLPQTTKAQDTDETFDFAAALETKLAYVVTGVDEVDRISAAGMRGLTRFLATRTALEPGEPVGLDISVDELSFYSMLYWPVDPAADLPDAAAMARVDAFMKQGGSILFDTRDQISGVLGGTASSPAARALQQILTTLDIPPLEPVPVDHVLTKSFYLLEDFPGRYTGGDLWVEVSQPNSAEDGRPVRRGDGVSSILITSNDMAGAWAVDGNYRPLLPTVPPDPTQRNYAFRVGVNLMMYALTGNYKADQVHLPALLERLGQ